MEQWSGGPQGVPCTLITACGWGRYNFHASRDTAEEIRKGGDFKQSLSLIPWKALECKQRCGVFFFPKLRQR